MTTRLRPAVPPLAIAVSLLIGLLTAPAPAAEYYVAQTNPAATDAHAAAPGTPERPFKTIAAALGLLKPGDTLYVRQGVYREMLCLSGGGYAFGGRTYPGFNSGLPGQPIRIIAWPGEAVVIKASDPVTGWKKLKDAVYVREDWPFNTQQVFCDGKVLQQIAGTMDEYLTMEGRWCGRKGQGLGDLEAGSFYCDPKDRTLYVWLADGGDPSAHLVEAVARPFAINLCDRDHIQISGFKIEHGGVGFGGSFGSFNTLENVEIAWADFCGLSVGGGCNTILACRSNHNGNTGISTYGWGHRVIDCETSFNNRRRWSGGWHCGGMKNFSCQTVISGCTAEGNVDSPGIWFDGSNAGVTIQNCRCLRNGGPGIMYEIGERAIIQNNLCYENQQRGIYISNSSYCSIVNNLCYKNGMSGIAVIGVDRPGGLTGDEETTFEPARNNVVWGNILMDNCHPDLCPKGWSGRAELILPDPAIKSNGGNVSDYNILFRSDGRAIGFWFNWGAKNWWKLADWQQQTGNDRHSIIARPLFANLAKFDFHPAADSPAIRFVRPRMGVRIDLDGRFRSYDGKQTAGPYEADPKLLPPAKPAAATTRPAK